MRQFLFAYGTLRRRLAPEEIAPVVRQLRPVGHGSAAGRLYDLGAYPAAVFGPAGPVGSVHGLAYRLPPGAAALRILDALDGYEGVNSVDAAAGLYRRVPVVVTLRSRRRIPCWAYAFNGPLDDGARVWSGCWHRARAGRGAAP